MSCVDEAWVKSDLSLEPPPEPRSRGVMVSSPAPPNYGLLLTAASGWRLARCARLPQC